MFRVNTPRVQITTWSMSLPFSPIGIGMKNVPIRRGAWRASRPALLPHLSRRTRRVRSGVPRTDHPHNKIPYRRLAVDFPTLRPRCGAGRGVDEAAGRGRREGRQ